ncbi:M15 family metallopeptidase [Microbacteriaceae bacterium VKM Ac-2854]|nr:M15 family metallopeptidase [Microbacteriaceae bacterium VKM Ac-2854]
MITRSSARHRRTLLGVALTALATVAAIATILSVGGTTAASAPTIVRPELDLGADGSVPDGVSVFDDDVPAVARLEPALLAALRRAAAAAAAEDVSFVVNSGWRSAEYQERLLREAVADYGSAEEAARWVATAQTSPHVTGQAVDLGPVDATSWLSQHGAEYGLCQIYANEPWHFELRDIATDGSCPAMYADPTDDPRMRS